MFIDMVSMQHMTLSWYMVLFIIIAVVGVLCIVGFILYLLIFETPWKYMYYTAFKAWRRWSWRKHRLVDTGKYYECVPYYRYKWLRFILNTKVRW